MSRLGLPILGTGSADQTAKVAIAGGDNQVYPDYGDDSEDLVCDNPVNRIFLKVWGMHSGSCLLEYQVLLLNCHNKLLTTPPPPPSSSF